MGSCDNGNFQAHSPCMGEALITSQGGAIGTMMSSPEMKGTMCKRQQEQAATAITIGVASRIGNIYNVGLMKGNAITRDTYAMQAYNVFGDPTQAIMGPSLCPHQRQRQCHQRHQLLPLCRFRCRCQCQYLCLRQHQVSSMQS